MYRPKFEAIRRSLTRVEFATMGSDEFDMQFIENELRAVEANIRDLRGLMEREIG